MPDNNLTKNDELKSEEVREVDPDNPVNEDEQSLVETEKEVARMDFDSEDEDKLPIDDELIKVEDSPYDELIAGDRKTFNDPNTDLPTTDISEQIIPRESDLGDISNNLDSTSKIYTLPDHAISSSEKKELLEKLHTKIPGIIQHQNGDTVEEKPKQQKIEPPPPPPREKAKVHKIEPAQPVEEKTEIFAPPQDFKEIKPESRYCHLSGHKIVFDKSVKLRVGEHVQYLGNKYGIKKRIINKSFYLKYALIGMICIFVAVLLAVSVFSGNKNGKLVGLLINSETQAVVADAQITINDLGQTYYTDENGLFIVNQITPGDWSLSASKPQYRTAALGFNIPKGQTRVVTLIMDPSVPSGRDNENDKKKDEAKAEKKVEFGKLQINTNVPDARVIIDNKVMGSGNQTYSRLYAGKHKLVITKEGYQEYSSTIMINPDKTTSVDINLDEIEVAYNPSEISYQEYLNKADDLSSKNKWQEALGNYTLALAKHEDGSIYKKRALAYQKLDQHNMAVNDLFKASQLYTNEGTITEAINCLTNILDLTPQNTRALRERGFAYLRSGKYDTGVTDLRKAVDIDEESFDNQIALGEALYLMGEYKESLKYLKKARKLNDENARVYGLIALASLSKGSDKDARKYYKEFTERARDYDLAEFESDPDWQRLIHMVSQNDN